MRSEEPSGQSEYQSFLSRLALYTLTLFCLVPLVLGIVFPIFYDVEKNAFHEVLPRVAHLLATGCLSFLIAFLPALMFRKPGIARSLYEFSLFPVAVICTAAQLIMFAEFGTEISDRILGLFQGNAPALWAFARTEYRIDWLIGAFLLLSIALAVWLRKSTSPLWKPSLPIGIGITFAFAAAAAVSLGLDYTLRTKPFYHPAKMSGAPLLQSISFVGEQLLFERQSGIRNILSKTAEVRFEDEKREIASRLGEEPEAFLTRTVKRPAWLRKKPSHVFLFVMESMNYQFISDPELNPIAGRLQAFAKEGISVPHFYASSGSTIDAIHSGLAGASTQPRYPDPRVLARMQLDPLPKMMKQAGFTGLFYAASHREFGNKGDSSEAYGYDQFIGLPDLMPEKASNEWGVHDGPFFRWASQDLLRVSGPKFVSFLNVSYHAPYDVPPEDLGDNSDLSPELLSRFYGKSEEEKRRYAGHVKYADREIGIMVDELAARYPDALFCFFGDHCGTKLKGKSLQQVPFILWSESLIDSSISTASWFGSHMDLPATFAHLVLPEGAQFATTGEPLWSTSEDRVSLVNGSILTTSGYWTLAGEQEAAFATDSATSTRLERKHLLKASALRSLSWGLFNDEPNLISLKKGERIASNLPDDFEDRKSH